MSIFYKDNDSQNFSELNIGSDRITTDKLIEAIKRRENLGDLEEISILNASTKEKFDDDQMVRSGSRVIFQLSDAFDGFDDADILEHVMTTKNQTQETPKPTNTRNNYPRYMPQKYTPKMPENPKPMIPMKPITEPKMTEDLSENLKCPICKNFMKDAVQALCCNEAFCEECIRKKSRCPNCNNEVNENNIIPNKILRENIEKNIEQTVDVPSPTNAYSSKPSEPVERSYHSYEEPKYPPPLEKRDSSPSQDLDTTNPEEDYSRLSHTDPRPNYQPPSAPGYFPSTPAPPMYNKPPPPSGARPGGFGGGMYPPNPNFRGGYNQGMYPPPYMGGYPNPPNMYGGYPPMYGGYPPQMNPYGMYGMRGMPNPYEGMDPSMQMGEYEQNNEEEEEDEEEVKSEKSKKAKKHKHKSEKRRSSEDRSRSRSHSRSRSPRRNKNKHRSRSRSVDKKKHKKDRKHRR